MKSFTGNGCAAEAKGQDSCARGSSLPGWALPSVPSTGPSMVQMTKADSPGPCGFGIQPAGRKARRIIAASARWMTALRSPLMPLSSGLARRGVNPRLSPANRFHNVRFWRKADIRDSHMQHGCNIIGKNPRNALAELSPDARHFPGWEPYSVCSARASHKPAIWIAVARGRTECR